MISPCTRECRMVDGSCTGCLRTSDEISNWRLMSVENRMKIMQRLKEQASTHKCPGCGQYTYCAMEDGKSSSACWCMSVPKATKEDVAEFGDSCYCRKCLTNNENK